MLENNSHFLQARMVADQRAAEITRLQDVVTTQVKENNDLMIKIETLKFVSFFDLLYVH